jgi:hypothetical protein
MPRTCTICSHPDRAEIDRALLDTDSLRDIAGRFDVSRSALDRHKADHLPEQLSKAQEADEVTQADDLLGRLDELWKEAKEIEARAKKSDDLRTAIQGIGQLARIVEVMAKIRGEIDSRPVINVVISPEWIAIRSVLLTTLRPFPEACVALAPRLDELETTYARG